LSQVQSINQYGNLVHRCNRVGSRRGGELFCDSVNIEVKIGSERVSQEEHDD
jgi:hypothetical protein